MAGEHGIPTIKEWQTLTRPFQDGTRSLTHLFSGRDDNLKQVDGAIGLYWEMFHSYSIEPNCGSREPRISGCLAGSDLCLRHMDRRQGCQSPGCTDRETAV